MNEIWLPLFYNGLDLSDRFLVSSCGKIYSLKSQKILKQTLNKSTGYFGVCVSLGSRENKKLIKTHIAVACTFLGDRPDDYVVNHLDGNKKNNNVENLEWTTHSENVRHAYVNDLINCHYRIRCINTGEVFNSVVDACKWCGLSVWSRSMREYLNKNKNRKTAGKHPITKEGLRWEILN